MNILITSLNDETILLPITILFWTNVCIYVLHIFEESVVPEVFVEKVKRLYFPIYSWNKFFWFNTILIIINICGVLFFESFQNGWIIFPLALMFERVFNGIYHLFETIITKKYSSGLLTSVIVWILMYLIIRYSYLQGEISNINFIVSLAIGLIINLIMIVPLVLGLYKKMK
jgi:hypothetical protein